MAGEGSQKLTVEMDARFPSGPWRGFFIQKHRPPGRHWMDLQLTFRDSLIRGEGRDWVGQFVVTGRYQLEDGKCSWRKKYLGKHEVAYKGYNEGRGIWGTWEIPPLLKDGFQIWPHGMGDPSADCAMQAVEQPEWSETDSLEPIEAGAQYATVPRQPVRCEQKVVGIKFLTEGEVSATKLQQIFNAAYVKAELDDDGDLRITTDAGPKAIVTVDADRRILRFMSLYRLREDAPEEETHAFVNKMNDDVILVRFSVTRRHVLMADYYLSYEEGVLPYKVVKTLKMFGRVALGAIRQHDTRDLVK